MANRKRKQDRTVNQAHMPRTNGPCKKSPDGLHKAQVDVREAAEVISKTSWMASWKGIGLSIREEVSCEYCGKKAMGTYSNNMLTMDQVMDYMRAGTKPTCFNGLDKLNNAHKS